MFFHPDTVKELTRRDSGAFDRIVSARNSPPGRLQSAMLSAAYEAFNLFAASAGLVAPALGIDTSDAPGKVQLIVRKVSTMLPATFVSEGLLRSRQDSEWHNSLPPDDRKDVDEHVMPIFSMVNGRAFMMDPAAFFDGAFTAAMLGPRCLVIGSEERRIVRTGHPSIRLKMNLEEIATVQPFLRYTPDHLSHHDRQRFSVFRIVDGDELTDLAGYSWSDWEAEAQRMGGAFQEAFAFHRQFSSDWRRLMPDVAEILARWQPKPLPAAPVPQRGHYTDAEQVVMLRYLADTLDRPDMPVTSYGMPAVTKAAGRKRIAFTVSAPNKERTLLFRVIIGPERGKFDFYHNNVTMHPKGRLYRDRFVENISEYTGLAYSSKPDTSNGHHHRFPGGLESVMSVLPVIFDTLIKTYPSWRDEWPGDGH